MLLIKVILSFMGALRQRLWERIVRIRLPHECVFICVSVRYEFASEICQECVSVKRNLELVSLTNIWELFFSIFKYFMNMWNLWYNYFILFNFFFIFIFVWMEFLAYNHKNFKIFEIDFFVKINYWKSGIPKWYKWLGSSL